MADFLTNLWTSIFTPGPTPTLLLATNATFALLQLLLLILLIATYSVHFAILSFLCGGLWYAINWFAAEVRAVQEQEQASAGAAVKGKEKDGGGVREGDADDEGEDTEVEEVVVGDVARSTSSLKAEKISQAGAGGSASGADVRGMVPKKVETRQRRKEDMDRSGEISTDSEWEKVSKDGS